MERRDARPGEVGASGASVAVLVAVEMGDARPRQDERGQSNLSRIDSGGKGRCVSERGRGRTGNLLRN